MVPPQHIFIIAFEQSLHKDKRISLETQWCHIWKRVYKYACVDWNIVIVNFSVILSTSERSQSNSTSVRFVRYQVQSKTERMEDKVEVAAFCYNCQRCVIVTENGTCPDHWKRILFFVLQEEIKKIKKIKLLKNVFSKILLCGNYVCTVHAFIIINFHSKIDNFILPNFIFRYLPLLRCRHLNFSNSERQWV